MKRSRYRIYLDTGTILTMEMLAPNPTMGLSEVCAPMKDGQWPIWLIDKVRVCVNPAHVVQVTAEEIEE